MSTAKSADEDIRYAHGGKHYLPRLTQAAAGIDPSPDPKAEAPEVPMHEQTNPGLPG
ncbi:MAG: hypothetical protein WD354_03750 [Acidimicrobiia bacterium]